MNVPDVGGGHAPVDGGEARASSAALTASIFGLAAGWIAAGSVGLMAHSLRHGLTWAALALAFISVWPRQDNRQFLFWIAVLAAGAAAVFMIGSPLAPLNVLAVSLVLAAVAKGLSPADRATVLYAAQATAILGIYRVAYASIPLVWYAADWLGWAMGSAAAYITHRPLWVGATMGGVDFLLPMLYIAAVLARRSGGRAQNESAEDRASEPIARLAISPWLLRFSIAGLIVLLGNLIYLALLSYAADVVAWLGPEQAKEAASFSAECTAALRKLVPWDVPALAAIIQCAIAFYLLRRHSVKAGVVSEDDNGRPRLHVAVRYLSLVAVCCLAAFVPVVTVLCPGRPDVTGKKAVFYEKGYVNWLKPEHGQYGRLSVGMYGLLPTFLETLGIRAVVSPDLSEDDLKDADAVVVIYPDKDFDECWRKGKLQRVENFVRAGGSLMVMGEHTVREMDGESRINDALRLTDMRVPFDSAVFAIGGWLHSYDAMSHPITAGIGDERNQFGVVIGASVATRWPAQPLLIGRWGFADGGDASNGESRLGNERYDAGEKLGDVLLAAEEPLGRGKVICFGDPSMLINGLTPGCHEFTSRLFTYLVGGGGTPQAAWRQLLGLACAIVLAAALCFSSSIPFARLAAIVIPLAASLAICTSVTHRAWDVLPDGARKSSNNLAYIDAGHLNADTPESWREDGLGALELTFMRNGYEPLLLEEITAKRLEKAQILFIDAPAREYSKAECKVVESFVRKGGIVIITVGYERAEPSRQLLSTFGFRVGPTAVEEKRGEKPRPLGHFKSPFFNGGDYFAFVRFHAGWPVYCDDPKAMVITEYKPGKPAIIVRRLKKGAVAVVGDTCFAMMKNLENEDGSPIEGLRENADFWRWFLSLLGDRELWYPPKPQVESTNPGAASSPVAAPPAAVEPKPADEPTEKP